jgi:hypothetical protein
MVHDAKITLHQAGKWWVAFHKKSRAQELTGTSSREALSWTPPVANPAGWLHAMNMWVPHGELDNVYSDDEAKGQITWFGPPAPGHQLSPGQ